MDVNSEKTSITIGRIIARSISGTITPAEQAVLDEWLQDDAHRQVYAAIRNGQSISDALSEFDGFDVIEGYERFQASIQKSKRTRYTVWMAAAAAILVFLAVSVTIYTVTRNERGSIGLASTDFEDIQPGGNRATLTLAGGRTITLDEARDGIVIGSDEITYNDGNPLIEVEGNAKGQGEQTLLALSTPRGGTYQITLPDGTQVWLNAESRLKYPPRFVDGERIVELTGEAYFSVAKDASRPFKVVSAGQEVEVLGTEFNVSAYPDDPEARTTLVAGSVRVFLENQPTFLVLVPGEQSYVSNGNVLTKSHVNVKKELAWKSGSFYFDTTSFQDLLRQVGRWYDVDVIYEGVVPKETFSGIMSRNVTLKTLLEFLNESAVNITLEGRTLVVRPEVTQQ